MNGDGKKQTAGQATRNRSSRQSQIDEIRQEISSALAENELKVQLSELTASLLNHAVELEQGFRDLFDQKVLAFQRSIDIFLSSVNTTKKSFAEAACQHDPEPEPEPEPRTTTMDSSTQVDEEAPVAAAADEQQNLADDEQEEQQQQSPADESAFPTPLMLDTTVAERSPSQPMSTSQLDIREFMLKDNLPDVDDSWDENEYMSACDTHNPLVQEDSFGSPQATSLTTTTIAEMIEEENMAAMTVDTTFEAVATAAAAARSEPVVTESPQVTPQPTENTLTNSLQASDDQRTDPSSPAVVSVKPEPSTLDKSMHIKETDADTADAGDQQIDSPFDIPAEHVSADTRIEDLLSLCVDCHVALNRLDTELLDPKNMAYYEAMIKSRHRSTDESEGDSVGDEFSKYDRLLSEPKPVAYNTRLKSRASTEPQPSTSNTVERKKPTSLRASDTASNAESLVQEEQQDAEDDYDDGLPDLDLEMGGSASVPPALDGQDDSGELNESDSESGGPKKTGVQASKAADSRPRTGPTLSPLPFTLASDDEADEIVRAPRGPRKSIVIHSESSSDSLATGDKKRRHVDDDDDDDEDYSNPSTEDAETASTTTTADTVTSEESVDAKKKRKKRVVREDSDDSVPKNVKRKKIKFKREKEDPEAADAVDEEEEGEEEDDDDVVPIDKKDFKNDKKVDTRRKIRKLKDGNMLAKETREAERAEQQRKKRIDEKIKNEEKLIEELKPTDPRLVLDYDFKTKTPAVVVDEHLSSVLKPHQKEGIKFMWNCVFESLEKVKEGDKGSGCLLAHCMGLGKTLQVTALVHTVLTNPELNKEIKTALILMPKNVEINWETEIKTWTKKCKKKVPVYTLSGDQFKSEGAGNKNKKRSSVLEVWQRKGGICLVGYNMFAKLASGKNINPRKLAKKFEEYFLDPGPDLVVCDEGHTLKSELTALSQNCSLIRTPRRIVLTGTPMQNNLMEYHCMIQFIKPNLLGNKQEFSNRFATPINNGQMKDSTESDVRFMKKRAHVLHNTLDGCIQRKDHNIIRELLLPKNEYVISIKLTDRQIELYRKYLDKGSRVENAGAVVKSVGAELFVDFNHLNRICAHPWTVCMHANQAKSAAERANNRAAEKNFLADEDMDDNMMEEMESAAAIAADGANGATAAAAAATETDSWWTGLINSEDEFDYTIGCKLVIFQSILEKCAEVGDKLLVFSQFLLSLDIIEKYLEFMTRTKKGTCTWTRDVDYFRMDGATDSWKRKTQVDSFNSLTHKRMRLFLISTRAGGIGINLVGANRCIIFDASFNPCYDTQAIYRIYRFGQTKSVYIYRFLAYGTMEEKIYQRQINKQSLSQRVLDQHQLDRHFTRAELSDLYTFEPEKWEQTTLDYPQDDVLKEVISECKNYIVKIHEHDSLLENRLDQGLTDEDRAAAWAEYEAEKEREQAHARAMASVTVAPQYQALQHRDSAEMAANFANLVRSAAMQSNGNSNGAPFMNPAFLQNPQLFGNNTPPLYSNQHHHRVGGGGGGGMMFPHEPPQRRQVVVQNTVGPPPLQHNSHQVYNQYQQQQQQLQANNNYRQGQSYIPTQSNQGFANNNPRGGPQPPAQIRMSLPKGSQHMVNGQLVNLPHQQRANQPQMRFFPNNNAHASASANQNSRQALSDGATRLNQFLPGHPQVQPSTSAAAAANPPADQQQQQQP